jgi:hypothetical protein
MGWIGFAIAVAFVFVAPLLLTWHLSCRCKQIPPSKSRRPKVSFSDDNYWPPPPDGHTAV